MPAQAKSSIPVKKIVTGIVIVIVLAGVGFVGVPWIITALNTTSTDDAYVNGHLTFVAARVPGQVQTVYVDDNNRVRKGDLLLRLDKQPYQVQVNIAQAAVDAANADLVAAQDEVRSMEAHARSLRYSLQHEIENVDNQVALLRSKVATLTSQQAVENKAQGDYDRALPLLNTGAITTEEVDHRKQALLEAKAQSAEALEGVYEVRVALGLPIKPVGTDDLTNVPDNLDQTFSTVREAMAALQQQASEIGVSYSFNLSPSELITEFYKRDPEGNIDRIYAAITKDAPQVKQAQTKLDQAQANLDQALLNLSYCDVVSEIDGVITRRDVNPGNNVIAGQSVMAVRSLTDIWIDANFKETQLADLRIGQKVDLDVDMYGSRQRFEGRISGFEFGTGSTLALLPPENATGNFVKVVQRLPVRIDLVGYDPDVKPLFLGLSVTPYVHVNEEPTGPDAGKVLQPYLPTSRPSPETQP